MYLLTFYVLTLYLLCTDFVFLTYYVLTMYSLTMYLLCTYYALTLHLLWRARSSCWRGWRSSRSKRRPRCGSSSARRPRRRRHLWRPSEACTARLCAYLLCTCRALAVHLATYLFCTYLLCTCCAVAVRLLRTNYVLTMHQACTTRTYYVLTYYVLTYLLTTYLLTMYQACTTPTGLRWRRSWPWCAESVTAMHMTVTWPLHARYMTVA